MVGHPSITFVDRRRGLTLWGSPQPCRRWSIVARFNCPTDALFGVAWIEIIPPVQELGYPVNRSQPEWLFGV